MNNLCKWHTLMFGWRVIINFAPVLILQRLLLVLPQVFKGQSQQNMAAIVVSRWIRRSLRRQRVFRDRRNPLDSFSDEDLYAAFRFRRQELLSIIDELRSDIEFTTPRQGSLPSAMQVL